MGVGVERIESSVAQVHGGCPSEVSSASDECDSCLDELLSDPRSGLDNSCDGSAASDDLALHVMFDDAVARYWRYRETLWSGLTRPIYLLISSFLE